jgi:FKBP-type peptidyl-prolyl cis-trans isomerase (trigger factor)
MFNRVEVIAGAVSVLTMALALYLIQGRLNPVTVEPTVQVAQAPQPGIIIVNETAGAATVADALVEAVDSRGNFSRMVIDNIKEGNGASAQAGDTVLVHYAGTLQDGTEFDNSRTRGEAFEFTLGAGMVIKGWDEGIVGMKEGGERILVIPPEKAYGDQGIGPIPGGATLVFKVELLEVKS